MAKRETSISLNDVCVFSSTNPLHFYLTPYIIGENTGV